MTEYYLQVLKDNISICLDTDVRYYHNFDLNDVIKIHMYSDKGPKVVFGKYEYDAEFTLDFDKVNSARLSIASLISKGFMVDITKNIHRDNKLKQLGI